jgi:hypothetical protein
MYLSVTLLINYGLFRYKVKLVIFRDVFYSPFFVIFTVMTLKAFLIRLRENN